MPPDFSRIVDLLGQDVARTLGESHRPVVGAAEFSVAAYLRRRCAEGGRNATRHSRIVDRLAPFSRVPHLRAWMSAIGGRALRQPGNPTPSVESAFMQCSVCQTPMQSLGQVPIRTGGTSGGWHLLLGELADVTEGVFPLDVYRCPRCKRVEFFDIDESLPAR